MISGFDEKLIEVIQSHPSIIVGTCDPALVPAMARGYGARVIEGGEAIDVLIARWPGPRTRANIERTGRAAVTFTTPETFGAYQIKGRVTETADCTPADNALAERFTSVIRQRIKNLGEPPDLVLVAFSHRELFRIRLKPEVVFDQTPGRNAGRKL